MKVTALSGGIGGARLVDGLYQLLGSDLRVIINTGDDLRHWGLHISPDVDTILYTLSGLADAQRGWGLREESWHALRHAEQLGLESWFQLGDRDLATHLARSHWLRQGASLSQITARLARAMGVEATLRPMSDAFCGTRIETTAHGVLPFQEWLVRERAPEVRSIHLVRDEAPAPGVLADIEGADLLVLPPSNPYVSIDPILALPGVRERVRSKRTLAVSPIVRGEAVKGPLAAMIRSIDGATPGPRWLQQHYSGLVDGWIVERGDEDGLEGEVFSSHTIMHSAEDRRRLASELLEYAARIEDPPR